MFQIVFFDIETTPNLDVVGLLPEPTAPGNYKDADKIQAYIAEKRQDQVSGMALDPDFCKVKSIAYKTDEQEVVVLMEDEAKMIKFFWEVVRNSLRICGYNIIGFDLPVLLRRSFELGIKPPAVFNLSKYKTDNVIDLMGILYNWNNFKGLKFVAKRYGIVNRAEGINGSMVDSLTPEQLAEYNASDVMMVYDLYNKMEGIYL